MFFDHRKSLIFLWEFFFFRLSFSLTLQREISSPLTSIGETIQIGALSNIPFEYTAEANNQGRIREFNLLNSQSTLIATE
jgi:hypothetical protein